jgi:hypothetical protein
LSGDDVDSFVASLVDLASDVDIDSEGDASESRSLFDDLECESTRSVSEYASVESASEKSVESESEAEQRKTEPLPRTENEKVIVALSDVKDGLSPLNGNGNAKGHGNGWFSKSSSLSTASTRADSFDDSSVSSSMGSSKSPRHLEVESEQDQEVGYLRYSREGKMGLGLGDNISSKYREFQMTPFQSSC